MVRQSHYRYSHTVGFFTGVGRGLGFFNPVDMAIGSEGTLYVLNRGSERNLITKRVAICTLDQEYLDDFSTGGTEPGEIMWPVAIALDSEDYVYVSDEFLNRISIFDKDGNFVGLWGVEGNGYGQFEKPSGIVFDQDDNLLVVDSGNHRIQRYTKGGDCLGQWGSGGRGDGELNLPWGINLDRLGNVYVADWSNDRIQKFDADGRHLATLGTSGTGDGELKRPTGISIDQDLNLIVADWGNERVQLLEPELDPDDLIPNYLNYQSGSIEKLFWGPMSVKTDEEGRVYILESLRHRIQIYRSRERSLA